MKRTPPKSHDLSDQIKIYDHVLTPDGYGGTTQEDVLYWTTYADIRPLKSSNRLEANQQDLIQVYRVTIRYRNDKEIKKSMTVEWKDKIFVNPTVIEDLSYGEYVTFDIKTSDNMPYSNKPDEYLIYAGSATAVPQTSSELQDIQATGFALNFSLQTGTVNKVFIIAIQSDAEIVSVTTSGLLGIVPLDYELQGQIQVEQVVYDIYALETAVPYSENTVHNVVIKWR